MAAAYGCGVSPVVEALRVREGGGAAPSTFWGFSETVTADVQSRMMSTGLPPEALRLVTRDSGPVDVDVRASVVYVSQDSAAAVLAALTSASAILQPGTVIILDRWWSLDAQTRKGFGEWANVIAPLKDYDAHFEIFHDNGWSRAFLMR